MLLLVDGTLIFSVTFKVIPLLTSCDGSCPNIAAVASFLLVLEDLFESFKLIFVSKDSKSDNLMSDLGDDERRLSFINISIPGPKLTLFFGALLVSNGGKLFNLIVPISPIFDVDNCGCVGVILITSFIMIKLELLILSKTQLNIIYYYFMIIYI